LSKKGPPWKLDYLKLEEENREREFLEGTVALGATEDVLEEELRQSGKGIGQVIRGNGKRQNMETWKKRVVCNQFETRFRRYHGKGWKGGNRTKLTGAPSNSGYRRAPCLKVGSKKHVRRRIASRVKLCTERGRGTWGASSFAPSSPATKKAWNSVRRLDIWGTWREKSAEHVPKSGGEDAFPARFKENEC